MIVLMKRMTVELERQGGAWRSPLVLLLPAQLGLLAAGAGSAYRAALEPFGDGPGDAIVMRTPLGEALPWLTAVAAIAVLQVAWLVWSSKRSMTLTVAMLFFGTAAVAGGYIGTRVVLEPEPRGPQTGVTVAPPGK